LGGNLGTATPVLQPISEPELDSGLTLEPELDSGLTLEPELDSGLYLRPTLRRKRKLVELTEVVEQGKFKQQLWAAKLDELYLNPWI
jgi:hypothetical protein